MEFEEFRDTILKRSKSKKPFKVLNSWGVYDAYKLLRKNKWYSIGRPLKEKEFYSIIRGVNSLLAENIANGETVTFPARMGKLELRKFEKGVSIVDGKLKITYPIDWNRTIRLWFEDEEARSNKTLLRNENKFVYHVRYDKRKADYENKIFYEFILNSFIKKKLKENINNGITDTLW